MSDWRKAEKTMLCVVGSETSTSSVESLWGRSWVMNYEEDGFMDPKDDGRKTMGRETNDESSVVQAKRSSFVLRREKQWTKDE